MNHKHLVFSAAFILSGLTARAQALVLLTQEDSKKNTSRVIIVDEDGNATTVSIPVLKVHSFSEGMAAIMSPDKKYGFIDVNGTLVISCRFHAVGLFKNELAWAKDEKGKVGFIDKTGKWVIGPEYDAVRSFDPVSGMARVKQNDKWFYVDASGDALQIDTDAFFDFSEGLAMGEKRGLRGYFDKKGEWIIEPKFQDAKKFENGYARVKMNGKWGIIDKSGKWVIEPEYEVLKDIEPGE